MTNLQNEYPLHTIFIFFLIISANYLGQLYPCKIQDAFTRNIYLKHFFGFLTLIFFVLLAEPNTSHSFTNTLSKSFVLYIIFLILMNTNTMFFIISLITLAGIYLVSIKKKERTKILRNELYFDTVNDALYIVFSISTLVGFLIYMGEKKIEYKNNFRYVTFILGNPVCKGFSPKTKYVDSFFAAFK